MKTFVVLPLALLIGSALRAQTAPVITTATDYGVVAIEGSHPDQDAVALGTDIGTGLHIESSNDCNHALAGTEITPIDDARWGHGVRVREYGDVVLYDNTPSSAGTSNDPPSTPGATLGPHALQLDYAVAPGTQGLVKVVFQGNASWHASGSATIDVDGDGQVDFTGVPDGSYQSAELPVTAGPGGVLLLVTTEGRVARQTCGSSNYDHRFSVYFRADQGSWNCNLTPFGRDCGLHLDAEVRTTYTGDSLRLVITGGRPFAPGALIVADRLAMPIPMPFSQCDLLLDPLGIFASVTFDCWGNLCLDIPFNRHCLLIGLQVISIRSQCPIDIEASNGVELACCE